MPLHHQQHRHDRKSVGHFLNMISHACNTMNITTSPRNTIFHQKVAEIHTSNEHNLDLDNFIHPFGRFPQGN